MKFWFGGFGWGWQLWGISFRDKWFFGLSIKSKTVVHPGVVFCENCGCDWLDNGLNPIGCPYCKKGQE